MPYVIGIVSSLGVAMLARGAGFGRDRAFYPTILIVVAHYYVLFAAMAGATSVLWMESIIMAGFLTLAVLGFRSNPWLVVMGLIGHGLFDAVHGFLFVNPGAPAWWPAFCLSFDVGAAAFMASFEDLRKTSRTRV